VELGRLTYGLQNHTDHQPLEGCGGNGGLGFFVPIRLCVRYHYIRQLATYGKVTIDYVPIESMLADILTKPLAVTAFKHCVQGLIATTHN
jgi:hypothetical protein